MKNVHNNIVIYLERRKTVPDELLHPAYMYPSCNQISYSTDLGYITQRQVIKYVWKFVDLIFK